MYPKPRTSTPAPGHRAYPYLLRDVAVTRPNQVRASDITYIPMVYGFMYLVAVLDWFSRRVLSSELPNTMDTAFCVAALEEALQRCGKPEIFNTDQGSQYTSAAFTGVLRAHRVAISMDGRGRFLDNIFVERPSRGRRPEGRSAAEEARSALPASGWTGILPLSRRKPENHASTA